MIGDVSTRVARLFVWAGGAMFVGSLALTAWWYAVVLGGARPVTGWTPIVFDVCLFSVFALHHSVFARPGVKAVMARAIPEALCRSVYVWTASLLLALVCLLWRPVGGELFHHQEWLAVIHAAVQVAGIALIALSVRAIDALDLAGIRPFLASKASVFSAGLQQDGPYRLVRHPLYFGWMLVVLGPAHLTTDRFLFGATSCLYLAVAIPWEERSLARAFGDEYAQYTRRVRWRMVPFVY